MALAKHAKDTRWLLKFVANSAGTPGLMLPPLMFRPEEMEALALGLRWVADRGDRGLSSGACEAMAKIAAAMPSELRREFEASALLVGGGRKAQCGRGRVRLEQSRVLLAWCELRGDFRNFSSDQETVSSLPD